VESGTVRTRWVMSVDVTSARYGEGVGGNEGRRRGEECENGCSSLWRRCDTIPRT